ATKRVLEQEPLLDVAQISATCDDETVPLPSPAVLPPEPPEPSSVPVPPVPPVPLLLVAADVPTPIDVVTDDDAAALLVVPIPASDAALPVPPALAPLASPVLFASAFPSANALAA